MKSPANALGRDFVVGDMHGMYEPFQRFLSHVAFDPLKDRMFSVGDLCDRGPDSTKCLDLMFEPWFYSVRGNHEELFSEFLENKAFWSLFMSNGGAWASDYEYAQLKAEYSDKLKSLPDVIIVEGCFNVIHADFYHYNVQVTQRDIEELNSGNCPDGPNHLWGRNYFLPFYGQSVESVPNPNKIKRILARDFGFDSDVLPTYCGHTPVRNPLKIHGKLINLDTGAFYIGKKPWAGLTFAEPKTGKCWKVSDDIYEVTTEVF